MNKPLHQRPRSEASLSDEYETPLNIMENLCNKYNIQPFTDICADSLNRKCLYFIDKYTDALLIDWLFHDDNETSDIWCNPPHSKTKEFILKADEQWKKHNINIMMIIPANSTTTKYFEKVYNNIEIHPIFDRITFLVNSKPSPYPARNGYFVVIWREL